MNWIKQNTKLAAILGVMILGGLGLAVVLYLSWADFSAQRDEWVELDHKASALENSKFTPNAENVALLQQKLDDYRDKFSTLQSVLLSPKLQQPIKPISETEFQARLKERARAVVQKAGQQAGKITDLPKDFALGFDEYTGSLPPSPETAAELNVQLDVTEKFIDTLLDAGVRSVESLERTRLPSERGGAASASTAPAPKPPVNKNVKQAPVLPQGEPVYDRYPIKCIFTCDSGPLQAVLNSLSNPAQTPQFLLVRQLHVENEKKEAPTTEEVRNLLKPGAPKPVAPPAPPSAAAARAIPPAVPAEPDAATIMGGENLKVYVEVDYLRFRQPAAEGAAAPAHGPAAAKR